MEKQLKLIIEALLFAADKPIRTKPDYAPYVLRMIKRSSARLSPAAMETLAIIAYKQPVIRHEIEQFRGVDTGGILRTLLEKNLIRIMGRKHLPGRPLIYGTTQKFLEVFDLNNLESLPKLKEIKEFGIGEVQATQTHENKAPAASTVPEEEIKTEARIEESPS
ncbi:MAG: SMC-Scp complex subunit ScpB [Desulfobacteraceae bacterium 4572_87]|nr:MAG: SMC-Scp complex subunit ScpB [Desulfobacteraceae bacterium 4572_87]